MSKITFNIGDAPPDITPKQKLDEIFKNDYDSIKAERDELKAKVERYEKNTFWNHGDQPIFISCKIRPDPYGFSATMEDKILIEPGGGINLNILNLKPYPLNAKDESEVK